jgi:hypothetical protein
MFQVYEDFLRAELTNSITLDGQQICAIEYLCDRRMDRRIASDPRSARAAMTEQLF